MKKLLVIGILLVAAVAFAVADGKVELVNSPLAQWFQSGMYIGALRDNPAQDTQNKLTATCAGNVNFDFDGGNTIGTLEWSWPVACRGARVGDVCMLSVDMTQLTGPQLFDEFGCRVIQDGGVAVYDVTGVVGNNPPDAGFRFRVFSNQ